MGRGWQLEVPWQEQFRTGSEKTVKHWWVLSCGKLDWGIRLYEYNLCTCLNPGLANTFSSGQQPEHVCQAEGLPQRTNSGNWEQMISCAIALWRKTPLRILSPAQHPVHPALCSCYEARGLGTELSLPSQVTMFFFRVTFTNCVSWAS